MALSPQQEEAVRVLRGGGAAVFPTDTVYGVGVSPLFASSPALLFKLKQRDEDKPVAWLVSGVDDLARYGRNVPDQAFALARAFWPGPLTLIVEAGEAVPPSFRSAEGTIGLRMPDSKTALDLMGALGSPLATTSANISGGPCAAVREDLDASFVETVGCAVYDDAGKSGVASTVVRCVGGRLDIVREGDVSLDDMNAVV